MSRKTELLKKLRRGLPDLKFKTAKLVESGFDHDVLVLDGRQIARFAKTRHRPGNFAKEVKFLKYFAPQSNLAIPRYFYFSSKRQLGLYPIIKGRPLSPGAWRGLAAAKKQKLLKNLAEFLTRLHGVPLSKVRAWGYASQTWDARLKQTRSWYRREYFPKMGKFLSPKERAFVENFMDYFCRQHGPKKQVLGHCDLGHAHVLITANGGISGIIDFGDLSLGDPARDFSDFWEMHPRLARQLYRHYRGPKDRQFLLRCRNHAVQRWAFLMYDGKIRRRNQALWLTARKKIRGFMRQGASWPFTA